MKNSCFKSSLLLLILLENCSPDYLTEKELKKYILEEKNGLHQVTQRDDYKIEVTFKPSDFFVLQEYKTQSAKDTLILKSLQKKYRDQYYFVLSISKNGREAVSPSAQLNADFSDILQNISFRMGEYVNATTMKQDTLVLKDFFFNRTFGLGSGSEILLVFDKNKTAGTDWLQINLSELGLGVGTQHFKFDKDDLDNTPHIDFKKLIK